MKICPMCKELLSFDNFSINRKRKDGLQCYCKTCSAKGHKFYQDKKKPTLKKVCKCGVAFETKSTIKTFCTNSCKVKYFNKINNSTIDRFKYDFKIKLEAKKEPKPNNFKKWTKYEELTMLEHRASKMKWKQIALELGRSSQSCKTRMRDLKKKEKQWK